MFNMVLRGYDNIIVDTDLVLTVGCIDKKLILDRMT